MLKYQAALTHSLSLNNGKLCVKKPKEPKKLVLE